MKINLKDLKNYLLLKVSLYYSISIQTCIKVADRIEKKLDKYEFLIKIIDKNFKYFFIFAIVIIYLCFKSFFQTGMGGDDSRIYMFFPTQYLENAATNKRFAALEAESNQAGYVNTLTVMAFLEKLGFNYLDFYFLIFFLGFLFFFLCLKELQKKLSLEQPLVNYLIFFLAILYPSNPLMVDQIWNNHWNSIFSAAATPLVVLIFLKIIFLTAKFWELLFFNLLLTYLSVFFTSIIHIIAIVLVLGVFFLFYILINKKDILKILKNILIFITIFSLTNIYWVIAVFGNYSGNPFITNASNSNAVEGLSSSLEYYGKEINNFSLILIQGVNPNSNLDIFYFIAFFLFYIVILISLSVIIKDAFRQDLKKLNLGLVLPFIVAFLTALYLQSISLTTLGRRIFVLSAEILYFLNGFRNYINKVPPIYTLFFLVIVFFIYNYLSKKHKLIKLSLILSVALISSVSIRNLILLEDYKFNMPSGLVRNTDFSSDSKKLFEFIKNDKTIERVVYIPLSFSTWSIYKNDNQLFIGNSPITSLTGVDDFNGYMYIEQMDQVYFNYKNSLLETYDEKEITNFLYHINFIGADTLILNNTINIDSVSYPGYENTKSYSNLIKLIKSNLQLVYETPNKEFSVFKLKDSNIISFKDSVYNFSQKIFNENFYSLDFSNEVLVRDSLNKELINFELYDFNNQKVRSVENIGKFYDSKQNLVDMNLRDIYYLSDSDEEIIFHFENKKDDIIRLVLEYPEDIVSIKFGVENKSASCAKKIFTTSECQIIKFPRVEKVGNFYTYTVNIINPTDKTFGWIKLKSKENLKNMNPKLYTGKSTKSSLENEYFNENEKKEFLKNLFVENSSGVKYQLPKNTSIEKINRDIYKIKVELQDKDLPILLTLNKVFSKKWNLDSNEIKSFSHFPANLFFNGWVIFPSDTELEITLSFKDSKLEQYKFISDYSVIGSIIILNIFLIYGISKTLIRKFWR